MAAVKRSDSLMSREQYSTLFTNGSEVKLSVYDAESPQKLSVWPYTECVRHQVRTCRDAARSLG